MGFVVGLSSALSDSAIMRLVSSRSSQDLHYRGPWASMLPGGGRRGSHLRAKASAVKQKCVQRKLLRTEILVNLLQLLLDWSLYLCWLPKLWEIVALDSLLG